MNTIRIIYEKSRANPALELVVEFYNTDGSLYQSRCYGSTDSVIMAKRIMSWVRDGHLND